MRGRVRGGARRRRRNGADSNRDETRGPGTSGVHRTVRSTRSDGVHEVPGRDRYTPQGNRYLHRTVLELPPDGDGNGGGIGWCRGRQVRNRWQASAGTARSAARGGWAILVCVCVCVCMGVCVWGVGCFWAGPASPPRKQTSALAHNNVHRLSLRRTERSSMKSKVSCGVEYGGQKPV